MWLKKRLGHWHPWLRGSGSGEPPEIGVVDLGVAVPARYHSVRFSEDPSGKLAELADLHLSLDCKGRRMNVSRIMTEILTNR
ncbi:hypothetical protein ACFX1Q_030297 [Malus domestica]